MAFFELNKELCNKDGICAKLCPAKIIDIDDNKYPYIGAEKEQSCIKCGQCVSFCPTLACNIQTVASKKLDTSLLPSAEAVDTLLKSRRSMRMFHKELVAEADIRILLDVVGTAPTATNKRNLRWIVVSGREKMLKIASFIADYFDSIDTQGYYKSFVAKQRSGEDVFLRGAAQLIIATTPSDWQWTEDGVIALSYLEIAAHSRNIGMCWAGFFTVAARNYPPLQEYLGLNGYYVCGAQMVGYPMLKARKVLERSPLQVDFI